ncbi:MAG: TetR/AcrR family transcriptional regulator C-terminal domain-containing protein [Oscillospiraceae bacterium]
MKREDISLQTKRTFAASLKRIMGKKPFSKITVSEIIQDCNMNRKTFYYHFEDIYALLHWMLQEEAIEVVRNFDLLVDYEDAIIFVVDYIENNDHILNCALDSIGLDEMKRFLYADFIGAGESLISSAEEKFAVTLDPPYKRFLTEFFTEALAGIFVDWLKNHRRQDRDEIVRYLSVTVRRSLEESSSACKRASGRNQNDEQGESVQLPLARIPCRYPQ